MQCRKGCVFKLQWRHKLNEHLLPPFSPSPPSSFPSLLPPFFTPFFPPSSPPSSSPSSPPSSSLLQVLNTTSEDDFLPDPEKLAALITPSTRFVVMCNPCNPTGVVIPRDSLEAIAAVLRRPVNEHVYVCVCGCVCVCVCEHVYLMFTCYVVCYTAVIRRCQQLSRVRYHVSIRSAHSALTHSFLCHHLLPLHLPVLPVLYSTYLSSNNA